MRSGHGRGGCRRLGGRRSTRTRLLSASPRLWRPAGGEAEGLRGARGVEGGPRPRPPWCATAAGHKVPPFPSHLASPPPRRCLSGRPHLPLRLGALSPAVHIRAAMPAPAQARHSAAFSATASTCRCGWVGLRAPDPHFWLLKAFTQSGLCAFSSVPGFQCLPHPIKFHPVP